MFERDLWKEIFYTIRQNKLRSFLTMMGVFWGIFMLIILSGAGRAFENGFKNQIKGLATNSAFFWVQTTTVDYKGFKRDRFWTMDYRDVEYISEKIQGVKSVVPRSQVGPVGDVPNVNRAQRSESYTIAGCLPAWRDLFYFDITKGRYLNSLDVQLKRKVCVIGIEVYNAMFEAGEDPIGEMIQLSGVYYQIVGVKKAFGNINTESINKDIDVPLTTMQQAYNTGDKLYFFALVAKDNVDVSKVQKETIAYLKRAHTISPDDNMAIGSENLQQQLNMFSVLFIGIFILTWIVGSGMLLAGIIGISNIMVFIVKERSKEIGIQRALGATPNVIIKHIVIESLFLTLVAGVMGLALGIILLYGFEIVLSQQEGMFFGTPEVSTGFAISALIVLSVAGVVAGFIPARRAMKIEPIEAIRAE
ncbi:MAG: ABC transporter permease [Bacteroidales bacterium]